MQLLILAIATITFSCSKEGPAGATGPAGQAGLTGPSGPTGPPGPAGTANVIYSAWATSPNAIRDSTIDQTLYNLTHISAPSLSQAILDNGVIQVYFRISTIGPYQLPYTSYAGGRPNVIQFLAKLNRIFLLRNNLDINVETGHIHLSSALEYRYVLIPGVVSGGRVTSGPASGYSRSELMAMSYEQITALFNIPPEGSNE